MTEYSLPDSGGSDFPSSGSSVTPTSVTIYETEPNYIEVKLPEGTTYTISDDNSFSINSDENTYSVINGYFDEEASHILWLELDSDVSSGAALSLTLSDGTITNDAGNTVSIELVDVDVQISDY